MVTCKEYDELPQQWKDQIISLIDKMRGKSWVADIIIEKSKLSSYEFIITVCKYNTVKGWATIGYVRNDLRAGGKWKLTYQPKIRKGESNEAGKTGAYY